MNLFLKFFLNKEPSGTINDIDIFKVGTYNPETDWESWLLLS
jgi:hypothetical protein